MNRDPAGATFTRDASVSVRRDDTSFIRDKWTNYVYISYIYMLISLYGHRALD